MGLRSPVESQILPSAPEIPHREDFQEYRFMQNPMENLKINHRIEYGGFLLCRFISG